MIICIIQLLNCNIPACRFCRAESCEERVIGGVGVMISFFNMISLCYIVSQSEAPPCPSPSPPPPTPAFCQFFHWFQYRVKFCPVICYVRVIHVLRFFCKCKLCTSNPHSDKCWVISSVTGTSCLFHAECWCHCRYVWFYVLCVIQNELDFVKLCTEKNDHGLESILRVREEGKIKNILGF